MKDYINSDIKIFLDTADIQQIEKYSDLNFIKGFTTNPSLIKKVGINCYLDFINMTLKLVGSKPISFEVTSDEPEEIINQAVKLHNMGENVYVKVPVININGELNLNIIKELISRGVKLNITAVFTLEQIKSLDTILNSDTEAIISVFAGRIADTGIDPIPVIKSAKKILMRKNNIQLLWASTREIFNITHAVNANCDIITIPPQIIKKIGLFGYNLDDFCRDTVRTFINDANQSNLYL